MEKENSRVRNVHPSAKDFSIRVSINRKTAIMLKNARTQELERNTSRS